MRARKRVRTKKKAMIEVEMSDDIRKYEAKTFGPFTMRQAVCILIGAGYSIPIAVFTNLAVDDKVLLIAALMAPTVLCGWVKLDGASFETILLRIAYQKFLTPARRKMIRKLQFKEDMAKFEKEEIARELAAMPPKERKKREKELEKRREAKENGKVKYSKNPEYRVYL